MIEMMLLLLLSTGRGRNPNRRLNHFKFVKHFTHYHLHRSELQSDWLSGQCDSQMIFNATEMIFHTSINACINPKFFPRHLSPHQVTWKSNKKEKHDKQLNGDTTANNSSNNRSNNTSTSNNSSNTNVSSSTREVVHAYLAFALLLPGDHAFSQDLYRALTTVAPMFPSITTVVGSGHDFKELCSQYNIRSFPKLVKCFLKKYF